MKHLIKNANDVLLAVLMGALGAFLLISDNTVRGNATAMGGIWAQPGTYIDLLAAGLLGLSILQLIFAFDFSGKSEHKGIVIPVNREIVITAVSLILYAILLPIVTFFPSTLALSIVLCGTFMMKENSGREDHSRKLSKKQIISILIYFGVLTVFLYLIFTQLLKCVLP